METIGPLLKQITQVKFTTITLLFLVECCECNFATTSAIEQSHLQIDTEVMKQIVI